MRAIAVVLGTALLAWTCQAADSTGGTAMGIKITSSAFEAGAKIPAKFTGEGADVSPALQLTGVAASIQ